MLQPAPLPVSLGTRRFSDPRRLQTWLDEVFAAHPVTERQEQAIRLCLEEAVTNVALHGYGQDAPGRIDVALWRGPGAIIAQVSDRAPAFDPLHAPPQLPERPSLQEGPLGGRGLGLIRRFATDVAYAREQEENRLTMEFAD